MQALKIQTTVGSNHLLRIALPKSFPVGEAEVIVLAKGDAVRPEASPDETLGELLDWLDKLPPSDRSEADIEAQIAEERAAWGE